MNATAIAAEIRDGISTGRYRHGTRLPAVRALAEEHGVSQQTIAAAYAQLAALGLVRTEPGSGTVVTAGRTAEAHLGSFGPPDLSIPIWKAPSNSEAREATTLVRQLPAPPDMATWGIADTDIVERTRVRWVDDAPVQHKITIVPYELASRRPEGYEGVPPLLAPVGAARMAPPAGVRFADWLGWNVERTDTEISAEAMDQAAAAALGVAEGTPAFRIVSIARDPQGGTVFVTVTTTALHHKLTLSIAG
ncbi:GntR family transcriptional regulator [Kitasatospora sp. NPDC004723]|uniref:GntR family transcriptional regulator n=1 Tax=Kitasatospora sp. NPDC004723 TaxID=3154288 RepID=UPI0033ACE397